MRYFTKRIWAGWQSRRPSVLRRIDQQWRRNRAAYARQLQRLLPRLSKRAARFFTSDSLHDGALLSAAICDAAADLRRRPRTTVILTVDNGSYERAYVYRLVYTGVKAFEVRPDDSLFPVRGSLFGGWGYDELLRESRQHLRHNILFQTGTEISIVFEALKVTRHAVARRPGSGRRREARRRKAT